MDVWIIKRVPKRIESAVGTGIRVPAIQAAKFLQRERIVEPSKTGIDTSPCRVHILVIVFPVVLSHKRITALTIIASDINAVTFKVELAGEDIPGGFGAHAVKTNSQPTEGGIEPELRRRRRFRGFPVGNTIALVVGRLGISRYPLVVNEV